MNLKYMYQQIAVTIGPDSVYINVQVDKLLFIVNLKSLKTFKITTHTRALFVSY